MNEIIYKGDEGTVLGLLVLDGSAPMDLSAATSLRLLFKRPDGVCVEKPGALATDGTDGTMQYITEEGFLSVVGVWRMQGHIQMATGAWSTASVEFRVAPPLCALVAS